MRTVRLNARAFGRALVAAGFLGLAGLVTWRLFSLYEGPWASFLRPTRDFLQAAAAGDSARLVRLGASDAAIRRALETEARHPEQLAVGPLRVISGQRSGDTVLVRVAYSACPGNILVVTFRETGFRARVEDVTLPCAAP